MRISADNVVVGGGPAGSMVALCLATAGRDVVLLEKQRDPHHKVCGEFISAEAVAYLKYVGVDPLDFGAHAIRQVRLHSGDKFVDATLPFTAHSLSRHILDQVLLEKAEAAGCEVYRGALVEKILCGRGGFSILLRGYRAVSANSVFLATGKHDIADLRRGGGSQPDLVGFKMHWKLCSQSRDSIRDRMELFLFCDGYGGISLIEDDVANLCFVIRQRRLRQSAGWSALLSSIRNEVPAIENLLCGAIQSWPRPLAISPIPYGYVAKSANGIWRIGDQATVIPSFTGDGISIALHSALLAAEMYLAGRTPDEYLARLGCDLRSGMRFARLLSQIMVTSAGRLLAPAILTMLPDTIGWIAGRTRIPHRALKNAKLYALAASHSPTAAR